MKSTKKHCSLLDERLKCLPLKRMRLHVISQVMETTKDKTPVTKKTFQEYDPSKQLRTLSVSDFSIQSLMSVGADMHLTNLSLDNHSAVDNLKSSLSSIDKSINANNVNV